MKLQIEKTALVGLLAKLTGAVEKRNTIPVLAHVALYADGDTLTGRATNLDIEVSASVPATVLQPGSLTAPASMLAALASKFANGALISIDETKSGLKLSAGKTKFELPTLPIDDFPVMASAEYDAEFTMPAFELHRVLDLTAKCQSTEETRYYLNGTYLHRFDGRLRGVSTDGHRLAQIDGPSVPEFPAVILPTKTCQEILKLLDAGDVSVSFSATKARFEVGGAVVVSKVVDGTFPDYTRVVPSDAGEVVVADAASIKAAVDRVATVADNRTNGVKLNIADGEMRLSVETTSGSSGEDAVEVEYQGKPLEIGFNGKYLSDVLNNCKGQDIAISLKGGSDPAVIRPVDDAGALYVLMPMRV